MSNKNMIEKFDNPLEAPYYFSSKIMSFNDTLVGGTCYLVEHLSKEDKKIINDAIAKFNYQFHIFYLRFKGHIDPQTLHDGLKEEYLDNIEKVYKLKIFKLKDADEYFKNKVKELAEKNEF